MNIHDLGAGECARIDGVWYARPPGVPPGVVANLCKHNITEHDDETITVAPSILITYGESTWHGFLERSVWRSV